MHNPLTTEAHNPASEEIDRLSALEIVRLMNAEDARVGEAVASQAEVIARAIDAIAERLRKGGRLIYLGAGTSGRLGVLDASECPPTFNSPPEQVVGLIAGGPAALTRAIEGAEDKPELAVEDLRGIQLAANDAVVGIATSGRTPYVLAGLQFARERGALAIAFSCNSDSEVASQADLAITPVVGPEVISGSTRLKAGTATKLVLNMLSTGAMVRIGKTFGNLMVDLRAGNSKLRARTIRITAQLAELGEDEAQKLLDRCDGELKTAVVAARCKIAPAEARRRLADAGGHLRTALGSFDTGAMPLPAPADVGMKASDQQRPAGSLVLGIDGGGTKTLALLASASGGSLRILGRGAAGPANPQVVGFAGAALALDEAVRRAFADASLEPAAVDAACLALAGAGRDSDRRQMECWAAERNLAAKFSQVHDALPVLAAGAPEGWGVAVIAGTGSLVYGQDRAGSSARAGGWGHLFGDEGSGYAIALDALRAVARAADGRGPATSLQDKLLAKLDCKDSHDLVPAIYARKPERREIAGLAATVGEAGQEGDAVALAILQRAADELAQCVQAVRDRLAFGDLALPISLAGGVLLAAPLVRELLMARLREIGIIPGPVERVDEPALGALKLAAKLSSAV